MTARIQAKRAEVDKPVGRTLYSLFKEAAEEDMEDIAAARFALKHVAPAALLGYVAREYRKFRRAGVRDVEQETDGAVALLSHPGDSSPAVFQDRVAWAAKLACQTFSLHDGSTLVYGEATPGQHREYAAFLETGAHSTLANAQRHRMIADEIEKAGCRNLNELLKKKGGRR